MFDNPFGVPWGGPSLTTLSNTKKINPLPVVEPECGPDEVHNFGALGNMCIYCGVARSWFSLHEGKKCNARIALREAQREQKTTLAQLKEQATAVGINKIISAVGQMPEIVPEKKTNALKRSTGRKFR